MSDDDDAVVEDVPPYEAITEVMRAIDPNEPPPGQTAGGVPAFDDETAEPAAVQPEEPEQLDEPVHPDQTVDANEIAGPDETAQPDETVQLDETVQPERPDLDVPVDVEAPVTGADVVADRPADDADAEVDSPSVLDEEQPALPPESQDTVGDAVDTPTTEVAAVDAEDPTAPVTMAQATEAPETNIDDGATVAFPVVESAAATEPSAPEEHTVDDSAPAGVSDDKSSRVKIAVIVGAAVAIIGVFYAADMLSSNGSVPRGVTVAGVAVGGLSHDDAEARLQAELGPRVDQAVDLDAGDQQLELVPRDAGLDIDWIATLDRAGSQPINPFTRLASFFTDSEIGVQSTVDPALLDAAVESIRAQTDRAPAEGDVVFEGTTPVGVTPAPGQALDVAGARETIETNWAFGALELPVETVDVAIHQDEVDRVLAEVAKPAVSAPVVFTGQDNAEAVLDPGGIARILSFEPDGDGALATRLDTAAATGILAPALASTETQPKDATFALGGGAPTVVPGVVGELVQWPKTLEQLPALLASTDARTGEAIYEPVQPELTTEGAQALGINEVVAEYTTGGFEYASGVNIGLTADIVNGALVKPGETFSLNEYTGPRGTAQGFVESGIIDNGRPDRAVGGGISQFATTLYNASYFGGMEDAGHTEHSYYISRYPEAREATVFEGAIDLKFTNPTKTGIVIESFATNSSVTVRLWGTKTVDVESVTGPRTNPTSPNTITLPAGPGCVASGGGSGFTASDTRVVTDIATGNEISRNTRTVKYDPIPIVRCESPEPPPRDEPAEDEPAPPAEDGE
ncbi:VanW family protein [Rhodococcus sovatensis]|uniref:VanW family protein n=2 Tax=Rhodococcus sovatensis TaxID=1805840 RepID=A0ABZ2PRS9_9NOCA